MNTHTTTIGTDGVKDDPERLTALVLLGIRDQDQFPLNFHRENCADVGLREEDIDEEFITTSRVAVAKAHRLPPAIQR